MRARVAVRRIVRIARRMEGRGEDWARVQRLSGHNASQRGANDLGGVMHSDASILTPAGKVFPTARFERPPAPAGIEDRDAGAADERADAGRRGPLRARR